MIIIQIAKFRIPLARRLQVSAPILKQSLSIRPSFYLFSPTHFVVIKKYKHTTCLSKACLPFRHLLCSSGYLCIFLAA